MKSLNFMEEVWKPVRGYEGYYEISNFGKVRSLDRVVKQGSCMRKVKAKIIKIYIGPYGYPCVSLCRDRKTRCIPIHRLLAKAFIPNPENKPFIDHIDTDKTNYRLNNLRWCTQKENMNNPLTLAFCKKRVYTKEIIEKIKKTKIARKTKTAPKKVYQFDKNGNFIDEFNSIIEAGIKNNISKTLISRCCHKQSMTAGGYLWSFDKNDVPIYKVTRKNVKPIYQYDRNGIFIKKWDSVSDAIKATGIVNISRSAKCENPRGKYLWRYEPL